MTRSQAVLAALVVTATLIGCDNLNSPTKTGKPTSPAAAPTSSQGQVVTEKPKPTPADRFKQFAAKVENELKQRRTLKGMGDARRSFHISYDVRKTDSLVSPVLGILEIQWEDGSGNVYSDGGTGNAKYIAECKYAFHEDRWVPQDITVRLTNYDELSEMVRGIEKIVAKSLAQQIPKDDIWKSSSEF
jgi:hypothetical protein